jgi:hypothetical protein
VALAQAFTHRLIVRLEANLLSAFEKLMPCQPEPYGQWSSLREMPLEQLRVLLMRAGRGRGGRVPTAQPSSVGSTGRRASGGAFSIS